MAHWGKKRGAGPTGREHHVDVGPQFIRYLRSGAVALWCVVRGVYGAASATASPISSCLQLAIPSAMQVEAWPTRSPRSFRGTVSLRLRSAHVRNWFVALFLYLNSSLGFDGGSDASEGWFFTLVPQPWASHAPLRQIVLGKQSTLSPPQQKRSSIRDVKKKYGDIALDFDPGLGWDFALWWADPPLCDTSIDFQDMPNRYIHIVQTYSENSAFGILLQ